VMMPIAPVGICMRMVVKVSTLMSDLVPDIQRRAGFTESKPFRDKSAKGANSGRR
jgi:hypothetical protein